MSNLKLLDPSQPLQFFAVCVPGLENSFKEELQEQSFTIRQTTVGGVELSGTWRDVWRANMHLRGCTRILLRIAEFSAVHLSQLDKRSKSIEWLKWLPKGGRVQVKVSSKRSKLYHSGAIAQRVQQAAQAALGEPRSSIETVVYVRLEKDWCTVSLDTSGDPLHKRGGKQAIGKAPLRETMAAMFLRSAGWTPEIPLVDPMCGSGTFLLEAAAMACAIPAGAKREFAFQHWPTTQAEVVKELLGEQSQPQPQPQPLGVSSGSAIYFGFDRDQGAVAAATANAERLGLSNMCQFKDQSLSDLQRPQVSEGLVMCNPPYGNRLGDKASLMALYARFGQVMRQQFTGWRVALVTNEPGLAKSADLPWQKPGPIVSHGGLKVRMWLSHALPGENSS